ncbi:hypothetical protein HELRODRAFT_192631 [Helobdella robusta]|uniref:Uncharacterized protein n=1 Tax=Helobdella robusta TaxID=6412 RepID=T1FU52_HELRO|nr:hypothetical protein HELRODRAFT_192631 [Helobdella robusta]ESO00218.1 hypothetical protein HELRODRAFT_192631 [Helobdella robusta]
MMTETGEATKKVKHKKKKQEKEIEKTKLEDLPYDEHLKGLQELKELAQNELFSGSKVSYKNKKAELKLDVEPVISNTDDDLLKNIEINKDLTEIIRIDVNGHKDNKENIKTDIADDVMSSVFHESENDLYSATEPNINIVIKEELENFKEIVSIGIISPTAPELDDADELGFNVGCLYPKLSHVENESEQLEPFTEEQLRTLYCNEWLQLADGFIEKFYNDSTDDSKHEFFHLVNDYKMARHKYLMLKQDIHGLKKEVQRLKSLVWQVNSTTTSLKGRCKDDSVVTGDVTYETISLNEGMALEHKAALDHLKDATHHMALTAFRVHLYRMRIEDYIRKFHDDHPGLLNVPRNLPVQFKSEVDVADDVNNDAVKLKELISVLFAFERMSVRDEEFVRDIRTWLTNMVGYSF